MDAANFSLNYSILSLPFKKGERVLVPLRYGEYQRSFLMDKTLKRGSVTLTESSIVIAFSKEIAAAEPSRRVGYDFNEKSIVGSDGTRYDLSEVARLHTLYGVRRSRYYERHPDDRRLKKKFSSFSKGEGAREPGAASVLHADSGKGAGKQGGHRAREIEGDPVRPRQGKRRRNGQEKEDCPLAIPPAPSIHRLQGSMGRRPRRERLCGLYVEDVPHVWPY